MNTPHASEFERFSALTDKQRECLALVADGLSSKEIAQRLGISPHTVDQRLDGARRTLQVHSRKQAAREYALMVQAPERFICEPINVAQPVSPLQSSGAPSGETVMVLQEAPPIGHYAPWHRPGTDGVAGGILSGFSESTRRLIIILALTAAMLVTFFAGLALAQSLSQVLRSH